MLSLPIFWPSLYLNLQKSIHLKLKFLLQHQSNLYPTIQLKRSIHHFEFL